MGWKTKEQQAAYNRAYYEKLKLDPNWRATLKAGRDALPPESKQRRRERVKAWREANKEHVKEHARRLRETGYFAAKKKEYRDRDPEAMRRHYREKAILFRFGLSPEAYQAMYDAQDGKCAICRRPETRLQYGKVMNLAVDHDRACCPGKRSCGKCIRRLLCGRCNLTLGSVQDSKDVLRAMVAYLEAA